MSNASEDHTQWLCDYNEQLNLYQQLYGDKPVNINEAFPSNYLKAADLQGKKIKVAIDRAEMTEFGDGTKKPALYFQGKEKGMILNRTNASIIDDAYGPDTDNWNGKEVVLYPARVEFKGQMVDALRLEIPQAVADSDDEIPF